LEAGAFVSTLAVVAAVILTSALLSGLVQKSGFPQVALFLLLGAAAGPYAAGLLSVGLDSPLLRVLAALSLALVLFTDALTLDLRLLRRQVGLALRVLGPGTLLSAAVIALAGYLLLGLSAPAAAILGAALASTDPVLLRGLLARRDVPAPARLALRLESGLNDAVLLPAVLLGMAFLAPEAGGGTALGLGARVLSEVLLVGPLIGAAVGFLAVRLLAWSRQRAGLRRDYEAIYSLGVAFAAFAAAEALHGSGFLAAFAAGLMIRALDVELCDCFVEYGETTAELTLLFTFVLFGAAPIWSAAGALRLDGVAFALVALFSRPLIYALALWGSPLERRSRWLVSWFGPRGLSSLLLALLPVFAGLPESERIFSVTCLVVLGSVLIHGGALMALTLRRLSGAPAREDAPSSYEAAAAPLEEDLERLPFAAFLRLRGAGTPVVVADARTARSAEESRTQAAGSVRLDPERAAEDARRLKLPRDAPVVVYCA
jgi:sodium/hydrogen antiporter